MPLTKIRRRDGEVVDFDRSRIENAIRLACDAIGETDKSFIPILTDAVVHDAEHVFTDIFVNRTPAVEDIQDIVERNLVKANRFELAKAYILYRAEREGEREEKQEKLIEQFENRSLKVTKSDGSKEAFDFGKIRVVFDRAAKGYEKECRFDDLMEAFKKNIVEDIRTSDINKLLIKTCVDLVTAENIAWQEVAGRIALFNLYKEACRNRQMRHEQIYSEEAVLAHFHDYIGKGLYAKELREAYTDEDILRAARAIDPSLDFSYGYTTILSLAKRYLLNPNKIIRELPQELYLFVGLFLAIPEAKESRVDMAIRIYRACAEQKISLATPSLMNSRTTFHQLSSCFKLNIDDDLRAIYHAMENMAQISKFGGGVGVYLGNIRSRGSFIRNVAGMSGGVNPWVKVINDTAVAVNQLGARLGAISVTLDAWHADIYDFLDLQTETGDIRSKAFDIFPAISVPDLFMRRVKEDLDWTLFDPHEIRKHYGKNLQDHFGESFEKFYEELERDETLTLKRTIKAKDLFKKFLKTVVETGMPYVFFRDTVNRLNPNRHAGNIYSTQLCTEICQNTSPSKFIEETTEDGKIVIRYEPGDTVVCNLASINIAKVNDAETIAEIFPVLLRILDNVITLNYYPIQEARRTAERYRSIGIGYLGLAEYLATRKIAYDSPEARQAVEQLFSKYAYHTYRASVDLAKERGTYPLYKGSDFDRGIILGHERNWFTKNTGDGKLWDQLFDDMRKCGTRFGYHTAPAPNTSTAGVVGTTAALLPIYKRYFVETNLSAPTVRVAPKLDKENFWYYKEYVNMDMNDVIDMMAVVYRWVDQSISFEWMIDPSRVSPEQLFGYYMKTWEEGIKTVYYVRSLSGEVKDDCVSCSG
jgi:ribonucleoside-diphosphate reductase alpha chain